MSQESRIIRNGKFRVFKDGRIFLIDEDGERELERKKRKRSDVEDFQFYVVAFTDKETKKWTQIVVAKLLAEAFLPNPEGRMRIYYKDGNPLNIDLNNIEWLAGTERSKDIQLKAARSRGPVKRCSNCGSLSFTKFDTGNLCLKCYEEKIKEERREAVRKNRQKMKQIFIEEGYSSELTKSEREFVKEYINGLTQSEIARKIGKTRQAVNALDSVVNKKMYLIEHNNGQCRPRKNGSKKEMIRFYSEVRNSEYFNVLPEMKKAYILGKSEGRSTEELNNEYKGIYRYDQNYSRHIDYGYMLWKTGKQNAE